MPQGRLLCDVMVSIGDFGSSCRGSNPLTTTNKSDILRLSKPNQTRLKRLGTVMSYGQDSR